MNQDKLIKYIIWMVFFIMALGGMYFLLGRLSII